MNENNKEINEVLKPFPFYLFISFHQRPRECHVLLMNEGFVTSKTKIVILGVALASSQLSRYLKASRVFKISWFLKKQEFMPMRSLM